MSALHTVVLATATLLFGTYAAAQPVAASPSAVASPEEDALYNDWLKDKSVESARRYFIRFPQGAHQSAIVDDICRDQQFSRIEGAPLLVRFRAYRLGDKARVHDGSSFSGSPGLSMSPILSERTAKKGNQFVFVLFELFAFDELQFKPADIAFLVRGADLPAVQLFPQGSPNMSYGAFELSPKNNTALMRLQAAWEVPIAEARKPRLRLYKSPFDLVALKVEKL